MCHTAGGWPNHPLFCRHGKALLWRKCHEPRSQEDEVTPSSSAYSCLHCEAAGSGCFNMCTGLGVRHVGEHSGPEILAQPNATGTIRITQRCLLCYHTAGIKTSRTMLSKFMLLCTAATTTRGQPLTLQMSHHPMNSSRQPSGRNVVV
jgi:hypothetical protein